MNFVGPARWALMIITFASLTSAAEAQTLVDRGRSLMHGIAACGNCHTPLTPTGPAPGMELAGRLMADEPPFTAYAPNLTPDPETGLGRWTDQQVITAIREGKRPDGSVIGPPMPVPFYRGMSDDDAKAIVAYLRQVPAVKNKVPASVYRIPLPANYGPPVGIVAAPPRTDRLAYGAYLAGPLGHCLECHSARLPNGAPDIANGLGAGGMAFAGPWGVSHAANLTPTNLARYTDDQVKAMITSGKRPDGSAMLPPMAYGFYRNIAAEDLDAIVAFLRTLPPK